MDRHQIFIPSEMTAWLQAQVDSGDSDSISQAVRKIIKKAMEEEYETLGIRSTA